MINYVCEYKNNTTNETKFVNLTKDGEKFVRQFNHDNELGELERLSIIKEIETKYLAQDVDLNEYTFDMVSDVDMTQVI